VSPLPAQTADHWRQRPGRAPGRLQYHWHVLFQDQPAVHELVRMAQPRLAGLPGLDLVPQQWLHLTTLVAGFADEVSDTQVAAVTAGARRILADVAPIRVTFGRVYYHPEAIVLLAEPPAALFPVLAAVTAASRAAGCPGQPGTNPWRPHVSVAYSSTAGPAGPLIAALGRQLPATDITVSSVSLVAQTQVGRSWQWRPVAEVILAGGGVRDHPAKGG
jgi:2'-5' RNA ligase